METRPFQWSQRTLNYGYRVQCAAWIKQQTPLTRQELEAMGLFRRYPPRTDGLLAQGLELEEAQVAYEKV